MKRTLLLWIAALCAPAGCFGQIDWENFLAGQDMIWNRLPEAWDEAPFLGNGSLGSYICREPQTNALRIDVGNNTVHDHRSDDRGIHGRCRLMISHFLLHPVGEIRSGTMRLDLWNAEASGRLSTDAGTIDWRAYVAAESPCIVFDATAAGGERDFSWEFRPENRDSPRHQLGQKLGRSHLTARDYRPNPEAQVRESGGTTLCWQPLLEGGGTATAWRVFGSGAHRTLVVSCAHSFPDTTALAKAREAVRRLDPEELPELEKAHRAWWHGYYPQSFVSLPDKKIENFYWAQIYKLASATRPGGGLLDNCGPWLVPTPWPNAWWNLNVQLSYWPLYASNRLELAQPLVDAVAEHLDNLAGNVPEPYRHDSAALPVATDFELVGACVGEPGSEKAQVGNLAWLCHNLWLHYRFGMDDSILRRALYPALRRAVNFYLHFLYEDERGVLHLKKTYSPEYGSAEDCNYDLALLRWGCRTLLEAADRLGTDDPLRATWRRVEERLADYPQDERGMMIGKGLPYTRSHRHYSHLLMFYPLYLLNADQAGSRELMERSVEHWHGIPGNILGYSYTGAASLYAAFCEGDRALEMLDGLFTRTLRPNTMYRESGPVIETPLSGAQSLHDMLLQSWGGKIRVFPAVPERWTEIRFRNLRTEGAFLVSAVREKGKTTAIRIESLAGEPCILKTDMEHPIVKDGETALEPIGGAEYALKLKKGESVLLTAGGAPEPPMRPVAGPGGNFFGLK
ncbi:glycoside hydrolase family 95-like protein [uncultured Alistipes sp.]|uniref:glycosyl hydrolase family 95 catalytic domain-containing protein n=2 Tax=uncultured Alistipes sp. TaxID=538949 RepID=UPI0025FECD3A|nr:alpha-L-fucosidase [uncultured Alistipes sp.]